MSHLQLVCSAVFPWGYAEDEQKCWEVYKAFDKSKLPRDVVVYFDLVHLSVALSRHEKCLVKQIRQLRRAKCREVCSRVLGDWLVYACIFTCRCHRALSTHAVILLSLVVVSVMRR